MFWFLTTKCGHNSFVLSLNEMKLELRVTLNDFYLCPVELVNKQVQSEPLVSCSWKYFSRFKFEWNKINVTGYFWRIIYFPSWGSQQMRLNNTMKVRINVIWPNFLSKYYLTLFVEYSNKAKKLVKSNS